MDNTRRVVGLVSLGCGKPESRILDWLTANLPVSFQDRNPEQLEGLDGVVFLARTSDDPRLNLSHGTQSLVLLNIPPTVESKRDVSFTNSKLTPWVFRLQRVPQELAGISPLPLEDGDEAIALLDGRPIWTARVSGSTRRDISAVSLPQSDPEEIPKDAFHGRNFIGLLPLYDFLQRLSGESEWSGPPARACFLFDDPNLHATTYGWLNYSEVAQHAKEHNYHVAFATVPLDAWYTARRSASLFAEPQARLSLLIHGNDHASQELLLFANQAEATRYLAQAIRRIERLEDATRAKVCRVMVPPHGDCSELSLQVMAQLGYEAVCTTLFVLRLNNPGKAWAQNSGLNIAEVVSGMPVLARFRLDLLPRNAALLAAYLGQPIILYGHHQDLADGVHVLDDLADDINSFGPVHWTNMRRVCRKNYKTRLRKGVLEVRAYARRFDLVVPSDVQSLSVQRPWLVGQQPESLRIRAGGDVVVLEDYAGESFRVVPGTCLDVESVHTLRIDPQLVARPRIRFQPFLRRQFCTLRDRVEPAVARFLAPGKKQSNGVPTQKLGAAK